MFNNTPGFLVQPGRSRRGLRDSLPAKLRAAHKTRLVVTVTYCLVHVKLVHFIRQELLVVSLSPSQLLIVVSVAGKAILWLSPFESVRQHLVSSSNFHSNANAYNQYCFLRAKNSKIPPP